MTTPQEIEQAYDALNNAIFEVEDKLEHHFRIRGAVAVLSGAGKLCWGKENGCWRLWVEIRGGRVELTESSMGMRVQMIEELPRLVEVLRQEQHHALDGIRAATIKAHAVVADLQAATLRNPG